VDVVNKHQLHLATEKKSDGSKASQ
jgi:hypothetical protein